MTYVVCVENAVWKYLSKLPKDVRLHFARLLENLSVSKEGHRLLKQRGVFELWEFKCGSHRVYYVVQNNIIIVAQITYAGKIIVFQAGNKNTQSRDIREGQSFLDNKTKNA